MQHRINFSCITVAYLRLLENNCFSSVPLTAFELEPIETPNSGISITDVEPGRRASHIGINCERFGKFPGGGRGAKRANTGRGATSCIRNAQCEKVMETPGYPPRTRLSRFWWS